MFACVYQQQYFIQTIFHPVFAYMLQRICIAFAGQDTPEAVFSQNLSQLAHFMDKTTFLQS
jgi:hypothetical protein